VSAVMVLASFEVTVGSPEFKETEKRLNEWGRAARQWAQALGLPTSSGIARMIEHVKVHEQLRRGVKPLKRSKLAKADPNADAVAVSREIRHSEPETIHAKETFSLRLSKVQWDTAVIQVEDAVKRLDKDEQKTLYRSYRFGQPDRQAAQELRMPKQRYQEIREAAVIRVAGVLADCGAFRHIA
jgi:hypothetical protein